MKIVNLIFWVGIGILILNAILRELFLEKVMFFIPSNIIGLGLIIVAWLVRDSKEKFGCCDVAKDYQSAYVTGKLVGGTVWADEPENTPGLGWIV